MLSKETAATAENALLKEVIAEQSHKIQVYHSQLAGANTKLENAQEQITGLSAKVNDLTNALDAIATLSSHSTSKDQE